jgi:hypothetical protein
MKAVDDDRSDAAEQEHGDDGEDDQEAAPHDGGSGYPGCVMVPRG